MVMGLVIDSASSADPNRSHPHPNPHRTTQTQTPTELFICFSSSSSMKLPSSSSKSILSPARNRDGPSLSASLSRRLRTNGSFKAASPMFPATGKKRGFDNPEPSSPKVTCIGQVRVKTKKKHAKKLRTTTPASAAARSIHRTPSNNPAGAGLGLQVSFRKLELSRSGHHSFSNPNPNPDCLPHRNQRWVHFPGTICEAIRTFGADWNCFSPCMSSKHDHHHRKGHGSSHGGRGDAAVGNGDGSSCGAVIARWLVAVHDGEGRDRTSEIELVVGGEDEEIPTTESHEESRRSRRRHIFEELEFNEDEICRERKEEEGNGRVSVCIPPKNALLLMRCRSDPLKMAALANRFCGSPVPNEDGEKPVEEEEASMEAEVEADESMNNVSRDRECDVTAELQGTAEADSSPAGDEVVEEVEDGEVDEEIQMEILEESDYNSKEVEEEEEDDDDDEEDDEVGKDRPEVATASSSTPNSEDDTDVHIDDDEEEKGIAQQDEEGVVDLDDEESGLTPLKLVTNVEEEEEAPREAEETVAEPDKADVEEAKGRDSVERRDAKVLPDCLLLMMCEPKLSMEVSKETWICSTDFIRWLPERQRRVVNSDKAASGGGSGSEHKKRDNNNKRSGNALTAHQARIVQQPPRSSCSFPWQAQGQAKGEGESMAAMIEQRLQNAKVGEPVVLTRCKSEPMRMAGTKVGPDGACFWKNRKLEPHRSSASNLNLNLMRVKAALPLPEVGS